MPLLNRLFGRRPAPRTSPETAPEAPPPAEAGWGLSIFSREPAALLLVNLAWHLEAGAREIHLYLDDPGDAAAEAAAALPGVIVTRCDAAFWAAHGGARPSISVPRQMICARLAYEAARVDWLIHLDADEFLFPAPGISLGAELAGIEPAIEGMSFPVRERVFTPAGAEEPASIFAGAFRVPFRGPLRRKPLIAPIAAFAPTGLSGHTAGKSAARTGAGLQIGAHFPYRQEGGERIAAHLAEGPPHTRLLHFDGLTARHWLLKVLRYDSTIPERRGRFFSPHRQAQIEAVAARRGDAAALLAFHDAIKACTAPGPWIEAGLIEQLDFDPRPAARKWLGALPDLAPAAFDAALRADQPELMRGL